MTEYIYDDGPVPTGSTLVLDNQPFAEDDYNDVTTYGARAALKIDLNDNWTITPQLIGQIPEGQWLVRRRARPRRAMRPCSSTRKVEGQLVAGGADGRRQDRQFRLTYAGAVHEAAGRRLELDYSRLCYFYDAIAGYGAYWYDNDYNPIVPNQLVIADDSFKKQSHELRITSPADKRLRLVAGLFYQRQEHNIEQNYIIDGLADFLEVDGTTTMSG